MTPPIDPISSSTDPLSVVPPVTPPASLTASSQITTHTTGTSSMLDQIMQTARESSLPPPVTPATSLGGGSVPPIQPQPPRQRDPMTAGTIMRLLGSLLLVIMIFFGSFLAYIVFHPDQAAFFVNIFGINPSAIRDLLKMLINGSFGTGVLILSIIWIVSLFRAIWTPRDQKRRRLISWLTASIVGMFLFGILALWAYLFRVIGDTSYDNLSGNVMVYDNDLYTHEDTRDLSPLITTRNIIGPITLRYDISINAKAIAKKNLIKINSYKIDFDGANCIGDVSKLEGSDPLKDNALICSYDQVRTYALRGSYSAIDSLGKTLTIDIPLDTVEIKGLVSLESSTNRSGNPIMTLDASRIKNLGTPTWRYESGVVRSEPIITELTTMTPQILCLAIFTERCDRYYRLVSEKTDKIGGNLVITPHPIRPLEVSMSLSGISLDANQITDIVYTSSDGTRLCTGLKDVCQYTFITYGTKDITATITLANKTKYTMTGYVELRTPLILSRHVDVQDIDNRIINTPETYDPALGAYVIRDITVPTQIILDARDIRVENLEYTLDTVTWKISDGDSMIEKIGKQITLDVTSSKRYTIEAIYTFGANIVATSSDMRTARDLIILDLDRKALEPIIKIQQSSDYAPAKITIDASSSRSKNGTITKFIFDWGEGRTPTEGDAIQTYEYRTSGNKKITLTVIDSNNERISTSKYIILKDTPKTLSYSTSMTTGMVGSPIDFVADGASGQIEEYIWNFGDNTPLSKGYEISHSFAKAGTYTISLTVRYTDGTERTTTDTYRVDETIIQ